MKKFIQYETQLEYNNPKLKRKNQNKVPTWVWVGASVFLSLLLILAISVEQSLAVQQYISEPSLLIISYFSYNLVVGSIFVAMIGAFLATLIYIFSRIFLTASLFLTFILISLLAPFIIPFFIKTSLDFAPLISFKSNLVEKAKYYEEKIEEERQMKIRMEQNTLTRLEKEEKNRLEQDATNLKLRSVKPIIHVDKQQNNTSK